MTMPIRKAAVIGSGTMGGGIAALLTGIGVETALLDLPAAGTAPSDPHERRNAIALAGIARLQAASSMPPLFDPADADKIQVGNLDDDLALVADCDWVIEVVVERLEVKQDLMRRLAPLVRPDVILSTNTSGLPIDAIASALPPALRPRFLGTHFFNPPRYLKLLEMIPGSQTDPTVLETMRAFATDRLEKGVVICKDTPNFIGNRFMTMLGMQTVNAALDGGFTVEEIDALTGPLIGRPKTASFRLNDLVGIDIVVAIARNLYPAIPDDPARALLQHAGTNALFDRMMANHWLGNKTKQGFYKAVKNEAGEREFWALDLTTFEYHPAAAPTFESVSKHSAIPDTGARIKALMAEDDRAARFVRQHLAFYLAYASQRVPEIADSLVSIDNAQKWGFSHELGPFEIWDALGAAETVPVFEALGFPVAAWVKTMLANGISSFYRRENGQVTGVYSLPSGGYVPLS